MCLVLSIFLTDSRTLEKKTCPKMSRLSSRSWGGHELTTWDLHKQTWSIDRSIESYTSSWYTDVYLYNNYKWYSILFRYRKFFVDISTWINILTVRIRSVYYSQSDTEISVILSRKIKKLIYTCDCNVNRQYQEKKIPSTFNSLQFNFRRIIILAITVSRMRIFCLFLISF